MKLHVVYSANIWPGLGASDATWTKREYAPRAAGSRVRDARKGVELR